MEQSNKKEYTIHYQSPIGEMMIASDGEYITGLWIHNQKYYASTLGIACCEEEVPVLKQAKVWLDSYFIGDNPVMKLPLAPKGSRFRRAVWEILCEIPYGQVTTYKEIANKIAKQNGLNTMSAQAVGGAVGHNPISIIIPCHRVIGTDGSLTGYAGGIEKKAKLLELEGVQLPR